MQMRFFLKILTVLLAVILLAGCSSPGSSPSPSYSSPSPSYSSPPPTYSDTIAEGRAAVQEVMDETGATALSISLTDGDKTIWSETFGVTDKSTAKAAVPSTMFSLCSVSKMFAAMAVMKLVDQGKVSLDEPLVTYLPDFRMASPEYTDITVRMLLNHSAGFPGGNLRNSGSMEPNTGFAAQMMEDLKFQRLKHAPGYLSVYSNDGFTMVENLVKAVSGQSYPVFVQNEILSPLDMVNSRYTVLKLTPDSYARPHSGDTPQEYFSLNMYATGGLYSTADDMAHLGSMLINGGVYNNRRILSAQSIAAMAEDQTLASFNPLPSDYMRFGLGWDSVASGGLNAVGIKAWAKGGDMGGQYAAQFVVVPEERLAVTVLGASNGVSSSKLLKVAERVLLKALVEWGELAAMPKPLDGSVQLPLKSPTDQEKTDLGGDYASNDAFYRVLFSGDTLSVRKYGEDGEWSDWQAGFPLRSDGWYAADGDAITALQSVAGDGRQYLAIRFKADGFGHYPTTLILAQKLAANRPQLSDVWKARTAEQWLPVNNSNLCIDDSNKACLSLSAKNLPTGYLAANGEVLSDRPTPSSEQLDGMILLIPQAMGRDLNDLTVKQVQGAEWLLFGSTLYRPVSGVENLATGQSSVVIGSDAAIEWRKLPATGTLSVSGAAVWRIFDSAFQPLVYRSGNGNFSLTGSGTAAYLMLLGSPGATITLNLAP